MSLTATETLLSATNRDALPTVSVTAPPPPVVVDEETMSSRGSTPQWPHSNGTGSPISRPSSASPAPTLLGDDLLSSHESLYVRGKQGGADAKRGSVSQRKTCSSPYRTCPHFTLDADLQRTLALVVQYHRLEHFAARQEHSRKERQVLSCGRCRTLRGRLHVCLHCGFIGCSRKSSQRCLQRHLDEKMHNFAVDMDSLTVFCRPCNDAVYIFEVDALMSREALRWDVLFESQDTLKEKDMAPVKTNGDADIAEKERTVLLQTHGLRGLANLGATCFMNVILQTFLLNPLLKAFFLSDGHQRQRCSIRHCLACQMDVMFNQVFSEKTVPYMPTSFLHAMWLTSVHMAGYSQQDAHEFFISVLDTLHSNTTSSTNTLATDQCDCVIHSLFSGTLHSIVTCGRCGNSTKAMDPFLDLSLDMSTLKGAGSPTTLTDCLNKYTQAEELGSQQYTCSQCGCTQTASKQLLLNALPPILSIQFKRFEHKVASKKIDDPVAFPRSLDMTPWLTTSPTDETKGRRAKYTLFAVVNHQGTLNTGHYTSFVKTKDRWFHFDDHLVTQSDEASVLHSNAYTLFLYSQLLLCT